MKIHETSITIDRPIDVVFKNTTCLKGCVNWQTTIVNAEQVTDSPLRVGSHYKHTVKFLGRTFEAEVEVTQFDPPHKFAFKDVGAPIPFESTYTFEETPTGTLVYVGMDGKVPESGLGQEGSGAILQASLKRQFDADLQSLKELLEQDITVHAQ